MLAVIILCLQELRLVFQKILQTVRFRGAAHRNRPTGPRKGPIQENIAFFQDVLLQALIAIKIFRACI